MEHRWGGACSVPKGARPWSGSAITPETEADAGVGRWRSENEAGGPPMPLPYGRGSETLSEPRTLASGFENPSSANFRQLVLGAYLAVAGVSPEGVTGSM